MGEKLELRLKSPVGAEPAVYPWPLPVYRQLQEFGQIPGSRAAELSVTPQRPFGPLPQATSRLLSAPAVVPFQKVRDME